MSSAPASVDQPSLALNGIGIAHLAHQTSGEVRVGLGPLITRSSVLLELPNLLVELGSEDLLVLLLESSISGLLQAWI